MKEFLKTNKVTYNLMSFTGFKSIIIFSLLLEGPKSYQELRAAIENHEYLHESVSIDTLRIYLNSLRKIGCKISKYTKDGITRYSIDSHPFELKITKEQAQSIIKVFKAIYQSIDISDLLSLQKFFDKFSNFITNEDLKIKLKNISPLHNINPEIIQDLMTYSGSNTEIIIYYNSLTSGKKNINIIVDKLEVSNGKLYLYGISSEHKNYSSFLVSRIIKITGINLKKSDLKIPVYQIGYEVRTIPNEKFELENNEKIINKNSEKIHVEITSPNKFGIMQRIMSLSPNCKILYPQDFKKEFIDNLTKMKEGYLEER